MTSTTLRHWQRTRRRFWMGWTGFGTGMTASAGLFAAPTLHHHVSFRLTCLSFAVFNTRHPRSHNPTQILLRNFISNSSQQLLCLRHIGHPARQTHLLTSPPSTHTLRAVAAAYAIRQTAVMSPTL